MLNNQNLKNKNIDYVPYDVQVGIWNAKCKGCPYAIYKLRRKTGFVVSYANFREAVAYATDNRTVLHRFCTFNDELISLSEIIQNHCMFWDNIPADPKDDTEVRELTEIDLMRLKIKIHSLENFVKLKE